MHSRKKRQAVDKLASCANRFEISQLMTCLKLDRLTRESIVCCVQQINSMRIPHTKLSPATLRAVVREFVTRDGTDYSSVQQRVDRVLEQLEAGRVELHFDDQAETSNIVTVEDGKAQPTDDVNG